MKPEPTALLVNLEDCLKESHDALLSRDVVRLEKLTAQQVALASALQSTDPVDASQMTGAVQAAARRVLQQAQVQKALLRRSQQSLQLLLRFIAGTQLTYGPFGCLSHGSSVWLGKGKR